MKTILYPMISVLIFLLSSCVGSDYIPSPEGDNAEITFIHNTAVTGELLVVTDTMIYVKSNNKIVGMNNKDLKQIYFDKYSNNSWITGVLLYQVLPGLLLSVAAGSAGSDFGFVFLGTLIPAAFTTGMFLLSAPKTTFDELNEKSVTFDLKKFARYPGGITKRQFQELLNDLGQDSCIYLK